MIATLVRKLVCLCEFWIWITTERKVLNIFGNLISLTNILIFRLQIKKGFLFEPFWVNLLNIR